MQSLARDGLSAEQVTSLLQASALSVSAGCELLRPDLTVREDISDDLAGGRVERNLYASIHGTCELAISRPLVWGVDLVRPYMTLSDGARTARFNVGVFVLTTPERQVGETPETFSVQGYDRLHYLSRPVGMDYTIAAGTTYRQAILNTFSAAGLTGVLIEGSAADDTLPVTRRWPLVAERAADPDQTDTPVTWLRVINDLLRSVNFRSVWTNEDGVFICQSYQEPSSRAAEFTLNADDVFTTILGEQRTLVSDVWSVPNRWVFRNTTRPEGAPPPTEGDGIYTVNNVADGPTSQQGRGLVWTSVIDYEAATQSKLRSLGDRRVATDRRQTAMLKATTGPLPAAGHADVMRIIDTAAGIDQKAQAVRWSMSLDGADMSWEFELLL